MAISYRYMNLSFPGQCLSLLSNDGNLGAGTDFFSLTVIAAALTFVMGQRYIQTSKVMPAGIVAGLR